MGTEEVPEADLTFIKIWLPEIRKMGLVTGIGVMRSADATISERVGIEASLLTLKSLNKLNLNLEAMIKSQDRLERTNKLLTYVALILAALQVIVPLVFH